MATGGNNYNNNRNQREPLCGEGERTLGLNSRGWAKLALTGGLAAMTFGCIHEPDVRNHVMMIVDKTMELGGMGSAIAGGAFYSIYRIGDCFRRP